MKPLTAPRTFCHRFALILFPDSLKELKNNGHTPSSCDTYYIRMDLISRRFRKPYQVGICVCPCICLLYVRVLYVSFMFGSVESRDLCEPSEMKVLSQILHETYLYYSEQSFMVVYTTLLKLTYNE